jgi:FkbM family methyltransferase
MSTSAELLAAGWRVHQADDPAAAERIYRQVLAANVHDAAAWCYLGMACHDQDRWDEAVQCYRRAIQIQPNFPVAFNNLGNTLRLQRKLPESIVCFDQALRLKPDYVNAHKNKGTALVWEGYLDQAVACYRQALQYAPDDAETHKNLGVIYLLQGDFARGWPEYDWRWKTDESPLPAECRRLWDGSSLDGKTIFLAAEQGLGDTVQFIRYGAVLKRRYDCRVIAACPAPLQQLLRTCPGVDLWVARGAAPPEYDCSAPMMSLPGILGQDAESFPGETPYLQADENLVASWQDRLSRFSGYKIGIVWQGNPQYQADRMRSFPLDEVLPLAALRGASWFSLQKGAGTEQLESLGHGLNIVSLGDELDETSGAFMDTAAVLKNLDLLITPDTAIAHVAGALGVPTWLALAGVPDWRWLLDRDDSPWYPSIRLFRQRRVGDWASVFEAMAEALPEQLPGIRRCGPEGYRVADSGPNRLIRARHGWMLYNRHDTYIGRSLELYGEFSEAENDLFQQILQPGSVVVEAGANIGAHTVVLARSAGPQGAVYAFEPQRVIFQLLCANLALNGHTHVVCRCEALGDAAGTINVPHLDYRVSANFGGLQLGGEGPGEKVPVSTIDSLQLKRCNLIKVDVEGMELAVLRGAAETIERCRPVLYVENDRLQNSPPLIEYLMSLGYLLYWHLPPLYHPANYFHNPQNVFGKIVSSNMLCVHRSVRSSISGLKPIQRADEHWLRE